jgi:hypothetical protein
MIHKSKDQATRIPLKTRDEIWSPGRVNSSCSTSGTRHVKIVKKGKNFFENGQIKML